MGQNLVNGDLVMIKPSVITQISNHCCVLIWLEMEALEKEYKTATVENEEVIVSYYSIQKQLDRLSIKLASFVHRPHYIIPFLKPGRLLRVRQFHLCLDDSLLIS